MKYGKFSIRKRLRSSPVILIVAVFVFALLFKAVWGIYGKSGASAAKLSQAQTELARLKVQEEDLSERVNYLSTEGGIEAELRTKYRAVKEGESVAVIVDRPETASAADRLASSTTDSGESRSWLARLLRKFGF